MTKGQLYDADRLEVVKYRLEYEANTHNGVIQMFGKAFLKNNIIDKKYGKTFNQLFSLRLTGDYEDRHIMDMKTEVLPLVEPAKELIDTVSEMAKKQIQTKSLLL